MATSAAADVIKSRGVVDRYDGIAQGYEADGYVVCGGVDCGDDSLHKDRAPLSIRFSSPSLTDSAFVLASNASQDKNAVTEKSSDAKHRQTCLLGVVHFGFDSADLSRTESARLRDLAKKAGDERVDVTGYTCSIGSNAYNQSLSAKRAKRVASLLEGMGVKLGVVKGKGECCPSSTDNKAENRRVELCVE